MPSSADRRIVIGASEAEIAEPGAAGFDQDVWTLLSVNDMDATNQKDWGAFFAPGSLSVILAEHMLEHLTWVQAVAFGRIAFTYLRPGGVLRVAVPDAWRENSPPDGKRHRRRNRLREAALADDIKHGHRVRYNIGVLVRLLRACGFDGTVRQLEWHSRAGFGYRRRWDPRDGFVQRSRAFDPRGGVSLIVEATKSGGGAAAVAVRQFGAASGDADPVVHLAAKAAMAQGAVEKALSLDPFSAEAMEALTLLGTGGSRDDGGHTSHLGAMARYRRRVLSGEQKASDQHIEV